MLTITLEQKACTYNIFEIIFILLNVIENWLSLELTEK